MISTILFLLPRIPLFPVALLALLISWSTDHLSRRVDDFLLWYVGWEDIDS